jgi:hypothetical protein
MPKFKFQVIIAGEAEAPNRESIQALVSTGVSHSLAVGAMVQDIQINVAQASKVLTLHEQ